MRFVTLSHHILLHLKRRGYTVITCVSRACDYDPTWFPEKIPVHQLQAMEQGQLYNSTVPLHGMYFAVIDEIIESVPDDYLCGQIFVENA